MEEKAFCSSCRKKVDFITEDSTRKTELDGVVYEYPVKVAFCKECGEVAIYKPYQEESRLAFAECVREEKGLVSLEMVQALPEKYGIGKHPLSNLLGWGEVTYSRFANGLVPSPAYSKVIVDLYEDPKLFMKLLLSNRNRITDVAFKKSYKATQEAMDVQYAGASKLISLANYLRARSEGALDKLGVQKIIYYIQGFANQLLGDQIVSRQPKAWAYGPVYGEEYHYEVVRLDVPMDDSEFDVELFAKEFTDEERALIDDVFVAFRPFSNWTLAEMTHSETPWMSARLRAGVAEGEKCEERIAVDDMANYFSKAVAKYGIESGQDIAKFANARYQEISAA